MAGLWPGYGARGAEEQNGGVQRTRPQTAQVIPCRELAPRTNEVVQEEAGGLLYALLFVLCCNFAFRLQPPRSRSS